MSLGRNNLSLLLGSETGLDEVIAAGLGNRDAIIIIGEVICPVTGLVYRFMEVAIRFKMG